MEVRRARPDELPTCFEVRYRVFVEEQKVPVEEDVDGLDAECAHVVVLVGGEVVGTARLRDLGEGEGEGTGGGEAGVREAKVERVAVLRAHRRGGVGRALMDALESLAWELGARRCVLGSQLEALPFYERLGYEPHGPVYMDANIPHRDMTKDLSPLDGGPPGR